MKISKKFWLTLILGGLNFSSAQASLRMIQLTDLDSIESFYKRPMFEFILSTKSATLAKNQSFIIFEEDEVRPKEKSNSKDYKLDKQIFDALLSYSIDLNTVEFLASHTGTQDKGI
jgi:hypothetical protein